MIIINFKCAICIGRVNADQTEWKAKVCSFDSFAASFNELLVWHSVLDASERCQAQAAEFAVAELQDIPWASIG